MEERSSEDVAFAVARTDRNLFTTTATKPDRSSSSTLFTTAAAKGKSSSSAQRSHYAHCNKSGHSIDGCFQLIGYPEWWPKVNSAGVNQGGSHGTPTGRGHSSWRFGHPRKRQLQSRSCQPQGQECAGDVGTGWANAATAHEHLSGNGQREETHNKVVMKTTAFPALNDEPWSTLLTIINDSNSNKSDNISGVENFWILDLGCSHHMTGPYLDEADWSE